MGNPLLLGWFIRRPEPDEDRRTKGRVTAEALALRRSETTEPTSGLLLFLRRMRYPLIAIILIFSVSVVGLTLIPKTEPDGTVRHMSLFDAFYVVSYTATTIGFGETPFEFDVAQRLWMTAVIYMSVVGWAYGVGSLLALTQDRSFRRAITRRHVSRKVEHLAEPFHILVGYGSTTRRIGRALDNLGRRFVVIDDREYRASAVDLDDYRSDTPALYGDARETRNLIVAGLAHPRCEGVLALTDDDRTNLDVTMTTALLRPGLPVIALTQTREMAERMRSVGAWFVVDPLDRFGDHLRILARSPAAYQLMTWLTSPPGTELSKRRPRVPHGRWVVCGQGRFAQELVRDLHDEGIEVTRVLGGASALVQLEHTRRDDADDRGEGAGEDELEGPDDDEGREPTSPADPSTGVDPAANRSTTDGALAGAEDVEELHEAQLESAVAFVAAADDDTANLWLLAAAAELNPGLFTVALEQRASNVPLFEALDVDFGMTAAEVTGREVLARLSNPGLMAFLPSVPRMDDGWSADLVDRLVEQCGTGTPELWLVDLDSGASPAIGRWLTAGTLTLGDLLRSPADREQVLPAVPLAVVRHDGSRARPGLDEPLRPGDRVLLAAGTVARRALDATLSHYPTAAYVLDDRFVPTSWLWRRLLRPPAGGW
ncbi:NAD(P)-binding protein [Intrasporangium sp.]|uniref:NAD(P)-binding protein n=1 Tax=Intrasporangium sp. TaxID=1925024 RepID=UPI003221904B